MKHDKKGFDELKALDVLSSIKLWEESTVGAISTKYNISINSVRNILSSKIPYLYEKEESIPFSINEEDYGTNNYPTKQMVTVGGMLVFKGNAPIVNLKSELSVITQTYIQEMKNNNNYINLIPKKR